MSHLNFGKAGLVLAISAWLFIVIDIVLDPWFPDPEIIDNLLFPLSPICSTSAVVFSLIGLWRDKPKKHAIAGLIVGGVLCILFGVVLVIVSVMSSGK